MAGPQDDVDSIVKEDDVYDENKGAEVASWVWSIIDEDANYRREVTRETAWRRDWDFIRGRQWDGPMPSYRRPVKMNAWRRSHHAVKAVLLGGRPMLKLVPQGVIEEEKLKVWQDALWSVIKREQFYESKASDAYDWALVGDGGWWKFGYGRWAENSGEDPDVLISSPHPSQIYPDKDCTDHTLAHCHHITFKDRLDLATITARYPARGMYVKPDDKASTPWSEAGAPGWVAKNDISTIGPSGGWSASSSHRRQMCDVAEFWTDDPSTEKYMQQEVANLEAVVKAWLDKTIPLPAEERARLIGFGTGDVPQVGELIPRLRERFGQASAPDPEIRAVQRLRWKYPKGRVITCTRDVTLRDIGNPYEKALSWATRWPIVYVPGAQEPHTVWRPGLLSDNQDLQWAINKGLSLLLENEIKVTNAIVIADDGAMEEEEWNTLQLFPGCKIRKAQGTDVSVVFPQPLPESAYRFPDYMIRKLEEQVGLADPQIPPGQSVAAKTVALMGQKGSFLLGSLAKGMDEANERAGQRIVGLMRDRYLPNKMIPYFEGEEMSKGTLRPLPSLPGSLQLRVEASSAFQEQQQAAQMAAQQAEAARAQRKR